VEGPVVLGRVRAIWTDQDDGDLGPGVEPGELRRREAAAFRRRGVAPRPVCRVRQVHSNRVVVVVPRAEDGRGAGVSSGDRRSSGWPSELEDADGPDDADGIVTTCPGIALAVVSADCGTVAFSSPEGVVGVAHCGWRGLVSGVLEAAVAAMRALGAGSVTAALGPCVHPECYEFSAPDLEAVEAAVMAPVGATTATGQPALDLPAGIRARLRQAQVDVAQGEDACTACSGRHFSYRATGTPARQALFAWLE
jgi:YfiH family protein